MIASIHRATMLISTPRARKTAKAILVMRAPTENKADPEIDRHCASFMKLQQSTAISALQSYRPRA